MTTAQGIDQQSLTVDDGLGVRAVRSTFGGHEKFSWDLFSGFASCRALTYSIDLKAVMRLYGRIGIPSIECVVGTQATLDGIEKVLAAQQIVIEATTDVVVRELPASGQDAVAAIAAGDLAFWVLKDGVAHSKIYLLDGGTGPNRRVIVGSANLSEQAFSGRQHEDLVMYDDDAEAWSYYEARYRQVRDISSQRIDPKLFCRTENPVRVEDTPLLGDDGSSAIVLAGAEQGHAHREASAVLKRAKTIRNQVGAVLPARRSGEVELDPDQKSAIRRALRHSPAPESKPPSLLQALRNSPPSLSR